MKIIMTLTVATSALTAGLCFDVSSVRAAYFGDATWCAVTYGDEPHWDCYYGTGQECVAALAAGIRGSCNVNPWPGHSTPTAAVRPKHGTQRAQRH